MAAVLRLPARLRMLMANAASNIHDSETLAKGSNEAV